MKKSNRKRANECFSTPGLVVYVRDNTSYLKDGIIAVNKWRRFRTDFILQLQLDAICWIDEKATQAEVIAAFERLKP